MSFEAKSEEQPLTPEQDAQLRQIVVDRAPAELAAVDAAATDEDLFYALPSAAYAAFHLEQFDLARNLAQRALDMAPGYPRNWNFARLRGPLMRNVRRHRRRLARMNRPSTLGASL